MEEIIYIYFVTTIILYTCVLEGAEARTIAQLEFYPPLTYHLCKV